MARWSTGGSGPAFLVAATVLVLMLPGGTAGWYNAPGAAADDGSVDVATGWVGAPALDLEAVAHAGGWAAGAIALQEDLAFIGIGPKLAIVDVRDVESPILVGAAYLGEFLCDVEVDGDLAYVGLRGGGLRIVNVARAESPQLIGLMQTGGDVLDLALEPGRQVVYMADSDIGVLIVDVASASAPKLLASISTVRETRAVAAAGNRLLAVGSEGLLVADATDPTAPRIVGSVALEGFPESITIVGNTAYIAARSAGLLIVDIADHAAPRMLARQPTQQLARQVEVSGTRAYVADGENGVRIIDIADPARPFEWAWFDTNGKAEAVAVKETTVFVAVSGQGIRIAQLAEGGYLREKGSFDVDQAWKLAMMDDLLLVSAAEGLVVLDTVEAGTPRRASFTDLPGSPDGIATEDHRAYLAVGGFGLWIFDLTDPWHPRHVGSFTGQDFSAHAVVVREDIAYVAGSGEAQLRMVDVSDPAAPQELSSCSLANRYARPYAIALLGNVIYVGGSDMGLRLFDVVDPANPSEIEVEGLPSFVTSLAVAGNRLYVTDLDGLRIYDVTESDAPAKLTLLPVEGIAMGVAVEGGVAYVASSPDPRENDYPQHAGVHVVDVSDPVRPFELGMYSTPGHTHSEVTDVVVRKQTAYLAARRGGVRAIDVTHAATPAVVGDFTAPTWVSAVEVDRSGVFVATSERSYPPTRLETSSLRRVQGVESGLPSLEGTAVVEGEALGLELVEGLAYMAGLGGGLMIADARAPGDFEVIGRYAARDCCKHVAVSGPWAYATGMASLVVLDVGDPHKPRLLSELDTEHETWGVAVADDTVFLSVAHSGMWVLDVSDRLEPERIGRYVAEYPLGIKLVESNAFIADTAGLHIVDVTDPAHPTRIGGYDTRAPAVSVEVVDDVAWLATGEGLVALDVSDPTRPWLLGSFDSPTEVFDVALDGGLAYVAQRTGGLLVLAARPSFVHAYLPLVYRP